MDILKKATETRIYTSPDEQSELKLDVFLSKTYTLGQYLYFLEHKDMKFTEYICKCSENKIIPVSRQDGMAILKEIEDHILPNEILDDPSYSGNKDYSFIFSLNDSSKGVSQRSNIFNIVISESVKSLINTCNIEDFIKNGIYRETTLEENLENNDTSLFEWNGSKFKVTSDVSSFTSDDWANTACIFLDGEQWQIKKWRSRNLVEIFDTIPAFYVHYGKMKSSLMLNYKIEEVLIDERSKKILTIIDFWKIIMERIETMD